MNYSTILVILFISFPLIVFAIQNQQAASIPQSCSQLYNKDDCTGHTFYGGCCLWCNKQKVCTDGYRDRAHNHNTVCDGTVACSSIKGHCAEIATCPNRLPDITKAWYYHVAPVNAENGLYCANHAGELDFSVSSNGTFGVTAPNNEPLLFSGGSVDNRGNVITGSFIGYGNRGCSGVASEREMILTCPNNCRYTFKRSSAATVSLSLALLAIVAILFGLF